MKVKDLQFPRHFLLNEIDLDADQTSSLLDYDIEVHSEGEADTVVLRHNTLVYYNPSSVTKFIYNVLYRLLAQFASGFGQDKLALGLFYAVKDYTYADFEPKELSGPPVYVTFGKVPVPAFIVHELIEPLVGQIQERGVLYMPCRFTDACRIIESPSKLQKIYNLPNVELSSNDFPLLMVNCNIHNSAAQNAALLMKYLEMNIGKPKADKVINNILLNGDGSDNILPNLILILRMLKGDPSFVADFIMFLSSATSLSPNEKELSQQRQREAIQADNYLWQNIKTAAELQTPQVFRQWSQWSLLMGLIEKQLAPMRGSMWPASELVKPHEEKLQALMKEKAKTKKKSQLNFEEMLETARELYDHNAIEPGKLIEVIMKDERAWKQ
jgi:hypothetical protein